VLMMFSVCNGMPNYDLKEINFQPQTHIRDLLKVAKIPKACHPEYFTN
jgi:hypothetical protein